jgi:hypothetical protein
MSISFTVADPMEVKISRWIDKQLPAPVGAGWIFQHEGTLSCCETPDGLCVIYAEWGGPTDGPMVFVGYDLWDHRGSLEQHAQAIFSKRELGDSIRYAAEWIMGED